MLGQRVTVRLLEVRQTVLQGFQFNPELVRFLCQELRRFTGALGALLDVFIQKQRNQFLGNLVRDFWLLVLKPRRKAMVTSPRPFTAALTKETLIALRISSIFSVTLNRRLSGKGVFIDIDPFQVLAGHHALAEDMTSMRSSTKVLLFAATRSGEIC